jgi:beta-lactamase regulating signal transducer with metallopeptidase domain
MIDARDLSAAALAQGDFVQQPLLQALAWMLLHFLWQGAALGLAAFFVLRFVRPERAATRYIVGVATLGLMLVTSAATFVSLARETTRADSVITSEAVSPASAPQGSGVTGLVIADLNASPSARSLVQSARESSSSLRPEPLGPVWLLLIVTGWSAGVLVLSFRLIGGWMLTRRLAHRAIDAVSPAVEAAGKRIAERLELRRAVAIFESGAVAVPTLVGWVKPVVLLPAAALAGLSPEQLQAILAHELAHVRRHDYLINLLQSVVETLLFYHPATWWVSAQVREEREHCCDDIAIEVCGDRLVYVSALAELTALATHSGFALAATDGSLVGRVRRLLGRQRPVHEPPPAWAALAVLILTIAGAGATGAVQNNVVETKKDLAAAPVGGVSGGVSGGISGGVSGGVPGGIAGGVSGGIQGDRVIQPLDDQWLTPPAPPVPPVPPAPSAPPAPPALPALPALFDFFPAPPAPPVPLTPAALPAPPAPPAPWGVPAPWALPAPPAPPAPSGLPAPPTPSAPPAPPVPPTSAQQTSGHMQWSNDDERVSVKWSGAFRLTDDERDIAWVEEGETVTISDGTLFASRVDIKGLSGGGMERTFSKNAFKREYEPEGRVFLAQMLQKVIRRSGMFAKDRVTRFLKQGGPDAVLAEIERLGSSSYVKRVYYTELLKQAPLSEPLLSRVLQRVPADVTSDYDRATLLAAILKQPGVTDAQRVSVARAVKSISSDYDQRRTLTAVMESAPLSVAVASAVFEATSTVNSSYDRAQILIEAAKRGGVTSATTEAFMSLVRSMPSSYDQRRVLTAVAEQPSLSSAVTVEAVRAAGSMTSSHDQSEMLLALIKRGGLTDAAADAFFSSAAEIDSSHDLTRVLRAVVAQPQLTERVLTGILRTAATIKSSHDRATLLVDVAGRHPLSVQARALYLTAAEGIGSNSEENRVLAALVKAERGR